MEARLAGQDRYYFAYRMSHESFDLLLREIRPLLPIARDSVVREPIPPEAARGCVLWRLGHGHSSRSMSELFGMGESTIWKYTGIICRILSSGEFFHRYGILVPQGDRLQQIMTGFENITGLPHIAVQALKLVTSSVLVWLLISVNWLVLEAVQTILETDSRDSSYFVIRNSYGSELRLVSSGYSPDSVFKDNFGFELVVDLHSGIGTHRECLCLHRPYYPSTLCSGPLAGTQGSATQDPHIAASDSSSDFDVMEGYPMQQHPESSSQDMHALGQQPGASMFSRLKETLSRATRSEHATNEINEGGEEVDSPFTSQIDLELSESAHVRTPATTPIGPSKLTPSKTLLLDDRSLAEVQEVERYILAAREKEIENLHKAEQRRAILAKAPMTSALPTNPLQPLESQLTRKEAQNRELIKNEKKMKEQLKYEDARFQKLIASYNTVKSTLTTLLQNQEPASAPSTSDSAAVNTLAALQEELQTEKLQRQLLVSGFMSPTAQHKAKVKQLELELAQAKAILEAVGSLASTSQIHQAETHLPIQRPLMPEMPEF
ncbi:hypothetical protein L7F22_063873 [Adiantum nelumboides]|nr:hypothetical protein [Adiantum nelumboides]